MLLGDGGLARLGDRVILRIVTRDATVEATLFGDVSACKTVTLPWPVWVTNLGWCCPSTSKCKKVKKCRHSVCLRTLVATNTMPLVVVVLCSTSGMTYVSIVGGRSSTKEEGSPHEKMMLSLGAIRSVV